MQQFRAGLLNPDQALERELVKPGILALDLKRANSIEQLTLAVKNGTVDFVMLFETPGRPVVDDLMQLRKAKPGTPVVLFVQPTSGVWEKVVNDRRTELVACPVHGPELQHRVARLLSKIQESTEGVSIGTTLSAAVKELRSPKSGKLDASRIAKAYGLSEADIARSINKRPQTINATPDADSLQPLLLPFERIARAIKYTAGTLQPALKIWTQSPNSTMPDTTPAEAIRSGHVEDLASLWDDVMSGQPD